MQDNGLRIIDDAVTGEFDRVEEKSVLDQVQRITVEEFLRYNMDLDYPGENTQFNLIESLYFESFDFKTLQDQLSKRTDRFKLRLRTYGPNAKWEDKSLCEIKRKKEGRTKKFRIVLDRVSKETLLSSLPLKLTPELMEANSNISEKKLLKRINKINKAITEDHLVPMFRTVYRRLAFKHPDVRVTLDDCLSSEWFNEGFKISSPEFVRPWFFNESQKAYDSCYPNSSVLEVKHSGSIPSWLSSYLAQHGVDKGSFSKFVWSLDRMMTPSKRIIRLA